MSNPDSSGSIWQEPNGARNGVGPGRRGSNGASAGRWYAATQSSGGPSESSRAERRPGSRSAADGYSRAARGPERGSAGDWDGRSGRDWDGRSGRDWDGGSGRDRDRGGRRGAAGPGNRSAAGQSRYSQQPSRSYRPDGETEAYRPRRGVARNQAAAELRNRLGLSRPGSAGAAASYGERYASADRYGGRVQTLQREVPSSHSRSGAGRRAAHGRPGRGRGDGSGGSGGPGGRFGREPGSWWRHWTVKKVLAVGAGCCAGVVLLVVAGTLYEYAHTPIPTEVSEAALEQSSSVYYSNGKTLLGTFSAGVDREDLTSAQIPPVMKEAMVAAEDRHFYTEGGISVTGTMRAAFEDLKGGAALQGGSTITEQFVKQYYLGISASTSFSLKFKEILVAIKLAHERSKSWILTQYLNTVPFGEDAYGVGAAAQTYFGEPASKLTVAQAAMLAAMPNQPSYFNPNPKAGAPYQALVSRWHYVLTGMVRDGALTAKQAAAQKFPKVSITPPTDGWTGYRGYLMDMVRQELESTYGFTASQIDTRGLHIVTTFRPSMMKKLYASVAADEQQMRADGQGLYSYAHAAAALVQPGTGNILAIYGGPGYGARHCVRVACEYNTAEAPHQVGSSFKPYVLATAIKQGMDAQDSVLNGYSPIWIPPSTNRADQLKLSSRSKPADPYGYWQCCTDDASVGPLNVVQATAISSDPGFEDLAHRVGVYNVLDTVNAFGVGQNPFNANGVNDFTALNNVFGPRGSQGGSVTIALGQGELTAIEQASTFATLADDGTYVTPHVISQLSENGRPIPLKITRRQVLTPTQAADADYALSFANRSTYSGDTAFPAAAWDRPVVGKTGTTQTAQSAWFIGAIPQYSLAVTLYTNEQNSTGTGETLNTLPAIGGYNTGGYGGGWPATIWDTFMTQEFANLPIQQLPTPDYAGFSKWVQVAAVPVQPKPHPTTTCKPGHSIFPCNPSPNPTHTCNPFGGQPCTSTSPGPNPSPSCNPDTEPCTSTSPLATADQNAVTTALVTSPADAESEAMAARRVSSAGRKASG